MNVCFTLRNSKNPALPGTIYIRVSISGKTSNISTSVKTYKKNWTGSQIKGVENSKQLNMELQKIKSDLFAIYYDLKATEPENLSAHAITDIYIGRASLESQLRNISFWDVCNQFFQKKYTPKRVAKNTIRNAEGILRSLHEYLKHKHLLKIRPNQLKIRHIEDLKDFLSENSHKGHDSIARCIRFCIRVLRYCKLHEIIKDSPILVYEVEMEHRKDKVALSLKELALVEAYTFPASDPKNRHSQNTEKIRDIFVFLCHTGFNISDYKLFAQDPESFFSVEGGKTFITMTRKKIQEKHKGKSVAKIPLFPKTKEILEKYDFKLPVFNDITVNKHLKIVGKLVGILDPKKMRTKVARKTFSNMFWNKKVDARVIQKMMGHARLTTTTSWYTETNTEFMLDELKSFL